MPMRVFEAVDRGQFNNTGGKGKPEAGGAGEDRAMAVYYPPIPPGDDAESL